MKAPTYDATTKETRMTATRDAVAGGFLQLQDVGNNVLVTFPLSPTGGTVTGPTWSLRFDSEQASSTKAASDGGSGTAATKARIISSATSASRISGLSVGTASTNGVQIDNVSIATGQMVTISAATIVHAADPA